VHKVAKLVVLALAVAAVVATSAFAGKPAKKDPPCSINPSPAKVGENYVVSVSGLPLRTAINLWITDPSGATTGRPLGSTPDGSFNLNESSSSAGKWTYTFSGPTKINNTTICSVDAY